MSLNTKPILSIVSPTRGNFTEYWLKALLEIKGNIEIVLVYPPGVDLIEIEDQRVKIIISPYKGEVCQRFVGLLNARGTYIIALDDDDFLHPEIANLTEDYFARFPESILFRLNKIVISYLDEEKIRAPWPEIPDIKSLSVVTRVEQVTTVLQELFIAPLETSFDIMYLINPFIKERKDMNGPHSENFTNRIWRSQSIQESLTEFSKQTKILGPIIWLPFWNLDRLLSLFIQAKLYSKDLKLGHWILPTPEQVRYIAKPSSLKEVRLIWFADAILAKSFPQFGYFWNLFFYEFYVSVKTLIGFWLSRFKTKKNS